MIGRSALFSAALLAALIAPLAARATPAIVSPPAAHAEELDLTGSLSNFTSPGGLYGPWRSLMLSDRTQIGNDHPGIALIARTDADLSGPTNSLGAVFDDTHDWSPKFYSYAAIGVSSGNVLPTRSAYLEGDQKFGRSLAAVVGFGGGVVVNPDGTIQRYLNFGPTWYHNTMNVTLRWLPSFTTGRAGTSTGILTLANGAEGTTVTTLTLLAGSQPPNGVVVSTTIPGEIGQRVLLAGIDAKHWINRKGGYDVGLEFERLTSSTSGDPLYVRRGLDVGIFRVIR